MHRWVCLGVLLQCVLQHVCDKATLPCFTSCYCDIYTLPTATNALHVSCDATPSAADPGSVLAEFSNITVLELTDVGWQESLYQTLCDIVGLETLIISSCPTSTLNTSLLHCFRTLIHLDLSNNSIDSIHANSFAHLQDLKSLNLSHNNLEVLRLIMFSTDLQNLEVLDLSYNILNSVSDEWFKALPSLRHINVTGNQLKTVASSDALGQLRELDMSHNLIRNLSATLALPHLQRLDLSANQIEEVESSMLQGLISLQELDLQANKITSAQLNRLNRLPKSLINLQLSYNEILVLGPGTLEELSSLVHINLSHNCISEISGLPSMTSSHAGFNWGGSVSASNHSLPVRLQSLDLSYNNLSGLSRQVLQHPALVGLRHLNLSHNNISQLPRYGIETLEQLETLDLSHNHITWLDVGTFKNPNLRSINLSHNLLIKVISMSFLYLPVVEHIDLSHNAINYLYRYVFYKTCGTVDAIHITVNLDHNHLETDVLWKLLSTFRPLEDTFCSVSVSLRYNRLTHLLGEALESYQKHTSLYDYAFFRAWEKVEFDVRDNPMVCDCVMYDDADALLNMRHTFDFNATLLKSADFWQDLPCSSPQKLNNETVQSALSKISCVITDYCPSKCDCTYYPIRQVTTVNCIDRGLTQFPSVLPMGTKEILLQRNQLRLLSENISSLYDVGYIDLSENFISYIEYDVWLKLIEVPTVLLHKNKLRSIPKNVMLGKHLIFKNMTLAGNDFRCICENFWLKQWLKNHSTVIHGINEILCTNSALLGRVLVLQEDDSFNCPMLPKVNITGEVHTAMSASAIAAMVVSSIVLVVLALVIYVVRWYGARRVHAVRTWRPRQLEDQCHDMYDVYISYSKEDTKWVRKELERRLLSHDPPYRVHLQHECRGSSLLTDYLLDGVDRCETVIIVLSANTLQEWNEDSRQTWQQVVQSGTCTTIVVTLHDLPTDLDLRDATCIHASDSLFWEKLFHSLPNPLSTSEPSEKLSGSLHFDLASQHHKKY